MNDQDLYRSSEEILAPGDILFQFHPFWFCPSTIPKHSSTTSSSATIPGWGWLLHSIYRILQVPFYRIEYINREETFSRK